MVHRTEHLVSFRGQVHVAFVQAVVQDEDHIRAVGRDVFDDVIDGEPV